LKKTKILVADDDAAVRVVHRDLLVSQGFIVDEAKDGVETIEQLKKTDYDVLLLDINMPNPSGLDVLRFVRQNGLSCRVIVLTGMAHISVAIDSIKYGADDYIAKPCRAEDLFASINNVLSK
jgi:DNA-binding response OmpR family regulator